MSKSASPRILERHIEQAAVAYLCFDGWYAEKTELNYSDKKKKRTGVVGMQDHRFTRPAASVHNRFLVEQLLVEFKRERGGKIGSKAEKLRIQQIGYHAYMKRLGFVTWIAGEHFPATLDGFVTHYQASGLQRKLITLGAVRGCA